MLAGAAATLAAASVLASGGEAGGNGRIAFQSDRDGATNFEIYSMRPDGTDPTRLTQAEGWDAKPEWSPDGTRKS